MNYYYYYYYYYYYFYVAPAACALKTIDAKNTQVLEAVRYLKFTGTGFPVQLGKTSGGPLPTM